MLSVNNIIKKNNNKNHFTMILVLMILTIVFPGKVSARMSNYSDFDWDKFYSQNKYYWSEFCEGEESEDCVTGIIGYQKDFYTKLYKMLAKYQKKGLYIVDDIILETVFFELMPSYTGNPTSGEEYNQRYAVFNEKNNRSAIKVDKNDPDPDIEDNFNASEEEMNEMSDYYDKETDTLKTLVKNMIAYYTYCYGSFGDVTTSTAADESSNASCPNGGEPTRMFRHKSLMTEELTKCAVNISASTTAPGYELGFWNYYTSRIENDTFLVSKIVKFFGFHVEDSYRNECLSYADQYKAYDSEGVYYVYTDQNDETGAHVSVNKYFDFLKTSKYFDVKPHLQHRFEDILTEAGVDCLTDDSCSNSLESLGKYDEYKDRLEEDRLAIIYMIIDILNERGYSIQYNGYGIVEFSDAELNKSIRSGYYWPIGSDSTSEKDGIRFADGTPAKTMNDVESYFGERKNPTTGDKDMHYGIDITTVEGTTNIVAAYDGVINSIVSNCTKGDKECNEGYGNTVIIAHSNGDYTVYSHLSSIDPQIEVSKQVLRGEIIGKAGSTGDADHSFLHYELRVGGNSVNNAVDPINNTSAGNETPPSDDDLRPEGYEPSGIAARSTRFKGTSLSKNEYSSLLSKYCTNHPGKIAGELCNDPGFVYDKSKQVDVNPELVIARAMAEGNSPGVAKHNYWGMGCTNTGGYAACITYSSVGAGIEGFGNNVKKYNNLMEMMSKYAYIGAYWYNPGTWAIGGCKYYSYISKYMSTGRASTVAGVCAKRTTCDTKGGDCTPTTQEDQDAYATWQVNEKLGPYMHNVFGS